MSEEEKKSPGCLARLIRVLVVLGLLGAAGLGYLQYRMTKLYSPDTYRRAVEKIGAEKLREEAGVLIQEFVKQYPDQSKAPQPHEAGLAKDKIPPGIAAIPNVARVNPTYDSVILRIPDMDYTVVEILGPNAELPEEHQTDHEQVVKVGDRIYYCSNY